MRKSILSTSFAAPTNAPQGNWLDIEALAHVEVSSEAPDFPIDNALIPHPQGLATAGWRAATNGPQTIRINFDKPQDISRIHLHIVDRAAERSQELAIYAGPNTQDLREVRRQQYSFSPNGSNEEIEDFTVDLKQITTLELRIDPDRSHNPAHSQHTAVLAALKLA